ncbi:unnamed protein product [Urochloa humidicola]
MAAAGNDNSDGMQPAAAAGKKPRKPYQITRPRERWAADEHGRFLHALTLFGRDWKRVEQFVGTKTATQVRSHAQKYFLKAQKLGLRRRCRRLTLAAAPSSPLTLPAPVRANLMTMP